MTGQSGVFMTEPKKRGANKKMYIEVVQSRNTRKSKIFCVPEIYDFREIKDYMDTIIVFRNKKQFMYIYKS